MLILIWQLPDFLLKYLSIYLDNIWEILLAFGQVLRLDLNPEPLVLLPSNNRDWDRPSSNSCPNDEVKLRCNTRFQRAFTVAFSKYLLWFEPTNVTTLKMQLHAINAHWKPMSKRSFKANFNTFFQKKKVFIVITLVDSNQKRNLEKTRNWL